jgi:hypothetical protein
MKDGIICSNCGESNAKWKIFCTKCGARIVAITNTPVDISAKKPFPNKKSWSKTGARVGVITSVITVIPSILLGLSSLYGNPFHVPHVIFLNLCVFTLICLIGGSLFGFIFGEITAFINHRFLSDKYDRQKCVNFGGLIGGLIVGLSPLWLGVGYL